MEKKRLYGYLLVLILLISSFNYISIAKQNKLDISKNNFDYEWEQVVDLGFGNRDNLHAWSMKAYKDFLYVGTRNLVDGCQIYRSDSGDKGSWKQVNIDGFCNESKSEGARHMIVYKDLLWIITNSWDYGTQVWVTNGEKNVSNDLIVWKKGNLNGFGEGKEIISSRAIAIYQDKLYVGSQSKDGHPLAFRYEGPTDFEEIEPENWTLVKDWFYDPEFNPDLFLAGDMANFTGSDGKEYLYVILMAAVTPLIRELRLNFSIIKLLRTLKIILFGKSQIWRYDGFNWENVGEDVFSNTNRMGSTFQVLNGSLYIGTANWHGGEIWKTVDGINWTQISKRGFNRPFNLWMWKLFNYNDRLIVGTLNSVFGCEVWASKNDSPSKQSDFIKISRNGMDGSKIFNFNEIPQDGARSFENFKGKLYVGTTNWIELQSFLKGTGCEVWRTEKIPISTYPNILK